MASKIGSMTPIMQNAPCGNWDLWCIKYGFFSKLASHLSTTLFNLEDVFKSTAPYLGSTIARTESMYLIVALFLYINTCIFHNMIFKNDGIYTSTHAHRCNLYSVVKHVIKYILEGNTPQSVHPLYLGINLTALMKDDGYGWLFAKVASTKVIGGGGMEQVTQLDEVSLRHGSIACTLSHLDSVKKGGRSCSPCLFVFPLLQTTDGQIGLTPSIQSDGTRCWIDFVPAFLILFSYFLFWGAHQRRRLILAPPFCLYLKMIRWWVVMFMTWTSTHPSWHTTCYRENDAGEDI